MKLQVWRYPVVFGQLCSEFFFEICITIFYINSYYNKNKKEIKVSFISCLDNVHIYGFPSELK